MFNFKKIQELQEKADALALKNAGLNELNGVLERKLQAANMALDLSRERSRLDRETINAMRAELDATKDCLDKANSELDRVARDCNELEAILMDVSNERDCLKAELEKSSSAYEKQLRIDRDEIKKLCAILGVKNVHRDANGFVSRIVIEVRK